MLVVPKIFVLVVVFDVVAKMDVVDTPNCGTVIVDVLNCGVMVVVDVPNVRTALFFIAPKLVILLAVVTGRIAAVDVAFEVLEVPKANRGLLVDEVAVEEVVDVLSTGTLDNLDVDVDVANDATFVNKLLAAVVAKILDVKKLKDLVVTGGNDVVWLFEGLRKVFTFDWMLLSDWPNMKLFDFGSCETVPLLPKMNEGGDEDVAVVRLFDVLLAVLLKPALIIDPEVVLTGNIIIPVD